MQAETKENGLRSFFLVAAQHRFFTEPSPKAGNCDPSAHSRARSAAVTGVMDPARVSQLKHFVDMCKSNPSVLADPSLSFFRDYLESLGANLPPSAYGPGGSKSKDHVVEESDEDMADTEAAAPKVEEEEEDEIIESDIEIEGEIVEPDNDPPQKMGDPSIEVTEENRDASQSAKAQAMEALSEGNLEKAVEQLTEAITLNPTSAIMYATRATVYIKMKKPNAAIRDANAALEVIFIFS
ncbi:hypothetical protein CRG98_020050 [Punica granatum]|uniref:Hsp70-interacting protein N-terminal domain-containing protein n=1 Tax=Punica granatum TaxID=22663 RepID=A0A2I0JTD0_PUNGR|nr:hypothetical protein CRG98_020050 [Punica granatum]